MHKTLVISFFIGDDHNPSGTFLSHLYIKWPNNDEYEANKETNPLYYPYYKHTFTWGWRSEGKRVFLPPKDHFTEVVLYQGGGL